MRRFCITIGLFGVIFGVAILALSPKAHGPAGFMIVSGVTGLISASLMRRRHP